MKRILSIMLVGMLVLGVGAWLKRDDILLAIIKIRSANAYDDVAEKTPVLPWGKGPEARLENADQQPPNIILIVADDLGINDISTFGGGIDGGRLKTPNIDRIASEGLSFTDYYGEQSCTAGRSSFMLGQSVFRSGLSAFFRFFAKNRPVFGFQEKMDLGDGTFACQEYGPLHEILQFAHITRPIIFL